MYNAAGKYDIRYIAEITGAGAAALFYAVFSFIFGFITLCLMCSNIQGFEYNVFLLFVYTALAAAAFMIFALIIKKQKGLVSKAEPYFLAFLLLAFFISHMIFAGALRFESAFDFKSVYKGAVMWTETGSFSDYYEYYSYFPNNLGAMTLLHAAFSAAKSIGITDYYTVGAFVNSALIIMTVFFSYLTARKISPPNGGAVCILFYTFSLPFWILSAAFYTDSLSMLFPVLFLYIYYSDKSNASALRHRINIAAMALIMAAGAMIKQTVVIIAAAVIIDMIISGAFRRAAVLLCACACAFMALQLSLNSYMYKYHLDESVSEKLSTPISHWIMMGLNSASEGAYSPADYNFTRSFDDIEKRNAAISGEIQSRIKEQGFSGLSALLTKKLVKAFGDGTYAISDFLDDSPAFPGKIHSYVLYDGENYYIYKYMTQPILIAVYIFMTAGAFAACIRKDRNILAPYTAVFGLMIFLSFWESSSRYFLNYVPVIFICASYGISGLSDIFIRLARRIGRRRN